MIDVVERKPNIASTGGTIVLKCKNFRLLNFEILGFTEFNNIATSVEWLSNLNDARLLYPYFYNPEFSLVEDGWSAFQVESEFNKLIHFGDDWRISSVNKNFEVCSSYPETVIVPKSITDECLKAIAQFRCLGRFPVLSYCHKRTKVRIELWKLWFSFNSVARLFCFAVDSQWWEPARSVAKRTRD